jgi:hypothetical protein
VQKRDGEAETLRNYAVEVGDFSYRRNREHMIPFHSKTAVFDNLKDGKESVKSAITQRQNEDVGASEMQVDMDEQPPARLVVERMRVEMAAAETARLKRATRKPRWLNNNIE